MSGVTGAGLPQAAALLGGLCVVGLALLTYLLGRRLLGLSQASALLAGCVLLLSRASEVLGQGVWREPFQTLAVYGLLTLALVPQVEGRGRRRLLLLAAASLGCLLAGTWDPFVFTVPFLLGGAWILRRPPLLAAGLALALTWGSWAGWRHDMLTAAPTYPAGIDGTVEETVDPPLKAWLNPNFLPRTARHNAYFWPAAATPLRPLRAAAPWFLGAEHYALTALAPSAGLQAGAVLLLLLMLAGLLRVARAPPASWKALILVALVGGLLGGPGLIGRTARYGFALLPLISLLVAAALDPLCSARPRRAIGAVAALGGLAALAWLAGSSSWSWARPARFEARAPAAALAAVDSTGRAVAAPINVSPDLAWGLPDRRVVTLPALPDWGLEELLADREVGAIVLPHEVHPWDRPGFDAEWRDEVHSLPTLAALFQQVQEGALTHLGIALEAELADRPRVRAYDVIWRGPDPPQGFGFWLGADSLRGLGAALEQDVLSPESRRLLEAHRWAVERFLAEPATREDAQRILDAL